MRFVDDPEKLKRMVIEFYEDDITVIICYLPPGTKMQEAEQKCKMLMEDSLYNDKPWLRD